MHANRSTNNEIFSTGDPGLEHREELQKFILALGADDVGFARASDYHSPKSRSIHEILPDAQSIIVLAFRVLSTCESPTLTVALNGYVDLGAFARETTYRAARFVETRYKAKVANIPASIPFEVRHDRKGVADLSHRHAAVAAGLGRFGRHNLVIHPQFGTRVMFTSIVTNLAVAPSVQQVEDLCLGCNLCVENCPSGALDEEGKTDVLRCMKHSQPYGNMAGSLFLGQLLDSPPEKQKEMLLSEQHGRLQQAHSMGLYYQCFNCMKSCPIGQS